VLAPASQRLAQPEGGVIGIGEPPTISTAAAVANAVRNAIETGMSLEPG
jgi:CO/xanthine dehydrogenase Mo-binding subunit